MVAAYLRAGAVPVVQRDGWVRLDLGHRAIETRPDLWPEIEALALKL